MPSTISVTGTFSSGKTTLSESLKRADVRINLLNELSAEAKSKIPEFDWSTTDGRGFLFWAQAMREVDHIKASLNMGQIALIDGSIIDAVAYSRIYQVRPPDVWKAYVNRYDFVLLCDPSIPLVEDGIRIPDQSHRMKVHYEILRVLDEARVDRLEIAGTLDERLKSVHTLLEKLIPDAKDTEA
jgi:nicotinamide riboside kinase